MIENKASLLYIDARYNKLSSVISIDCRRMYIKEETLDDLLHRVISKLLKQSRRVAATRGGASEISGVLLHLTNPRARLSRTEKKGHVFSCLGELLWYLAGTNEVDFISYYVSRYSDESEDGKTVHGAYGPRLFNMNGQHNQIDNVINLLKAKPTSRRAAIQIFDAGDLSGNYKEIPCTCTLQLLVRGKKLHMITYMRSNDAFLGLPHDIFTFTMLQEVLARSLGLEIGSYKHAVGSLHLYDTHRTAAEEYISEAFQAKVSMPPMPSGDPWRSIRELLRIEFIFRNSGDVRIDKLDIASYWKDLARLLQIYRYFKDGDGKQIGKLKTTMSSDVYAPYIEQKRITAKRKHPAPSKGQLLLFV